MARQTRYELTDLAMNGRLEAYLTARRANGCSYREIADDLAVHHGIVCPHSQVWEWCRDLGLE
jgi:hypothetical protein